MWFVYILKCSDGSFYTGVCKDVDRRVEEHSSSNKAAKYTRARRPLELVFYSRHRNRASACQREAEIKNLRRSEKEDLITTSKNKLNK